MSITIPMWVFYTLGGVALAILLALAALGVMLLYAFSGWKYR